MKVPIKLLNSFSINMLTIPDGEHVEVRFSVRDLAQATRELAIRGVDSCIGHESTAAIVATELGMDIPCRRKAIALARGERFWVAQYRGSRLPEGATELPEGAEIAWIYGRVTQILPYLRRSHHENAVL